MAVFVASCSGGSLAMTEYSRQGAAVTAEVEERIAALDAELAARPVSVEGAATYWERRMEARTRSLEGLDPPAALHGPP